MHPRPPWGAGKAWVSLGRDTCGRAQSQRGCFSTSSPPAPLSPPTPPLGSSRSRDAPLRMAVVGSGPAGFYTASRVMSRLPNAQVDMYEALPVPFGLVRHGVAPDHPEVKNCQDRFDEIASSPNFRFVGNVSVGRPGHAAEHCIVRLESLMRHYDSILMAYGASEDKKLGIPGESTLSGIYSARQFVGWYNGLPDCAGLEPELARGDEAVIIGQGNVALDVARILLEDIDVLRKTDIAEHALAQLAKSRVRRVHVVGRRGPMQAAFTIKEVRELMKLADVAFHPVDRSLVPQDLKALPRASRRLMEVVLKGSPASLQPRASKSWSLDSCLSPKLFLGHRDTPTAVASTEFDVTSLEAPFDPQSRVATTGRTLILPSDVVFRSVGYKSVALPGFAEAGIQFDGRRGVVSNDGLGRAMRLVSDGNAAGAAAQQVPGMYCAGWVKRGPTGVIASTMQDAFATGDAIVQDWLSGARFLRCDPSHRAGGWEAVAREAGPSAALSVSWDQWRKIDGAERGRGRRVGKEREKFTSTVDMLSAVA
ncbi:NADPH:adrenodoxin oxidoreductase, mitochondrial [Tolypocladium paradoxum]|uniref:NADPH:adrenodoxin oxidoreductase, mitochondrial n=1 Tax=Tolypocladium paradoxum TaxID=94208 RepID=A0A2S4L2G6_9HYPO|nr:NADPH:adrenodoxin oxidoreductase, mitochondrial [Tolypocladium paradoxum]